MGTSHGCVELEERGGPGTPGQANSEHQGVSISLGRDLMHMWKLYQQVLLSRMPLYLSSSQAVFFLPLVLPASGERNPHSTLHADRNERGKGNCWKERDLRFNYGTPHTGGSLFPELVDNCSSPFPPSLGQSPAMILPLTFRYVDKLEKIFQNAPADPTQDFSTQVYVARACVQRLLTALQPVYAFLLLHDHLERAAVSSLAS